MPPAVSLPDESTDRLALQRRLWLIVALLFTSSFLNYLDRQTLSVLKPTIKAEFGIDDAGYAILVNAFTLTYAAAYMLTGWIVDRIGARLSLTIFVIGWSIATVGCGLATSFMLFGAFRALLGLMEPGLQPAAIRAMTLWAPPNRRAVLMSLCGAGGTMGAVAAPPLIASLAIAYSWHAAFIVPGLLGLGLAVLWWIFYRDKPVAATPAEPMEATTAVAGALPWIRLWRQRSLWGIVLARFISDPVWYYCLFWMPGYFQEKRGLTLQEVGWVGWIPFMAGNLGGFAAAALSDRLARRRGNPFKARRNILLAISVVGPLAAAVPHAGNMGLTLALLSCVAVVCLTWLFLLGPLVSDTFHPGNVASVWSIAGAFGATGAILFNFVVGQASAHFGDDRLFLTMGLLHPLAALVLYFLVRKPGSNPVTI